MGRRGVKSNFIYTLTYNFLNILIPFIITPILSRKLGAENIGIYSYYYAIAYYFVIVTMLGLNNYGNRSIASVRDDAEKLSKTFWDIYYLQLFMSVLAIIVYSLYFVFFAEQKAIAGLLLLYVISAGLDVTWAFFGLEQFKFTVIRNLIIKCLTLSLILLFVKRKSDLGLYTAIMSAGFLLSQLFLWTRVKGIFRFRKPNIKDSLVHLKPNLVLFIPVVAISIYNMMDKIMLGNMQNMEQVGFYDSAIKIINIPQVIVTALGTVMLPKITNLISTGGRDKATNYLNKSLIFVAVISSAFTFGIMTVSKEFVNLYLGPGFEEVIMLLHMLMPCLIFKAYANVARTQYLIPMGFDAVFVKSVCFGAIINFVFNFILIPRMAARGACIGTIAAEIFVAVYQLAYLNKKEHVLKYVFNGLVFQVFGLIMYIAVSAIPFKAHDAAIVLLIYKTIAGAFIYIVLSISYFLIIKTVRNQKRGA